MEEEDYTQHKVMNKRVRFFDGQFLQAQDFIDEQKYHLDRERRQSRLLRVTGIISGLTVSSSKPYQITVANGIGVDKLGRQLVLDADLTLEWPTGIEKQEGIEVHLVYQETPTDLAQTGAKKPRRWDESPKIVVLGSDKKIIAVAPISASSDWQDPTILLARLAVADHGKVTVDATVAHHAGLSVPGTVRIGTAESQFKLSVSTSQEHLQLQRESTESTGGKQVFLELRQNDSDPPQVPTVSPSIRFQHNNRFAHRLEAQSSGFHFKSGDLSKDDYSDIKARGIVATGRLEVSGSGGRNVDLLVNGQLRSDNNDGGLWVSGDRFVGGHSTNQIGLWNNNNWRLTVLPDGNVGIGTNSPPARLTVQADSTTIEARQIVVQGKTNPKYELALGYHTEKDYGSIQALIQGSAYRPLLLNPAGGQVVVGSIRQDRFPTGTGILYADAIYVNSVNIGGIAIKLEEVIRMLSK